MYACYVYTTTHVIHDVVDAPCTRIVYDAMFALYSVHMLYMVLCVCVLDDADLLNVGGAVSYMCDRYGKSFGYD